MSEWTLIDEVAAGTPTPGGGAAAAYVGALGSALNSMVGNLTVGKKSYVDVEDQVKECLSQLQRVREELLALSKKDSEAFAPLAACFKMPRATEEEKAQRTKAMQKALIDAIEVPLSIMKACLALSIFPILWLIMAQRWRFPMLPRVFPLRKGH